MSLIKTFAPTPGKILFMIVLSPAILLLLIIVFSLLYIFTAFTFAWLLLFSVIVSYAIVSLLYQVVQKVLKAVVIIGIAALVVVAIGLQSDRVRTQVNNGINQLAGGVDDSCVVDEDCVVSAISCDPCPTYGAASAQSNATCLFSYKTTYECQSPPSLNVSCQAGQCVSG